MSRLSADKAISGAFAAQMAAYKLPDMPTLLTVTWTTDAPAAANGTVLIADGDLAGVTGAEISDLAREAVAAFGTVKFYYNELLRQLRIRGLDGGSSPEMPTVFSVTYTTDDPATSPDGAVTISDGDGALGKPPFAAMCDEVEHAFSLVADQHNAIREALMAFNSSTRDLTALGVLLALTYTTDDPATTANGAVTIADGDAATAAVASGVELYDEIEAAFASVRTYYNNLLTAIQTYGLAV